MNLLVTIGTILMLVAYLAYSYLGLEHTATQFLVFAVLFQVYAVRGVR